MRATMTEKGLRELRPVASFELAGVCWECRNGEHVEAVLRATECGADARGEEVGSSAAGAVTGSGASRLRRLPVVAQCAALLARLRNEAGFAFDASALPFNAVDVERLLTYHAEKKALAALLLPEERSRRAGEGVEEEEPAVLRVEVNIKMCLDCHEFFRCAARLFARSVECRDGARLHCFDVNGECSCGGLWR